MSVIMFVDGVLRSHTGAPIYQGLAIYRLFNDGNRVVLLCNDRAKDDRWLKEHKINKLDDLIDKSIPLLTDFPEYRQVEYCRGKGTIDLVITSDPELAKRLIEVGITTMVFMQPSYIQERFRPDSSEGRRTWGAISDEIKKQQDTLLEDPRLQQ